MPMLTALAIMATDGFSRCRLIDTTTTTTTTTSESATNRRINRALKISIGRLTITENEQRQQHDR